GPIALSQARTASLKPARSAITSTRGKRGQLQAGASHHRLDDGWLTRDDRNLAQATAKAFDDTLELGTGMARVEPEEFHLALVLRVVVGRDGLAFMHEMRTTDTAQNRGRRVPDGGRRQS